jgi:hypothetical protein
MLATLYAAQTPTIDAGRMQGSGWWITQPAYEDGDESDEEDRSVRSEEEIRTLLIHTLAFL